MQKFWAAISTMIFVLFACGMPVTPAPTTTPAPLPTTSSRESVSIDVVNKRVDELVSEGYFQEFARCYLDAAVWGSYDIELIVSSEHTKDAVAHVFAIRNGEFSESATSENPDLPATFTGSGTIEIEDQETAFELGIPFFVTDVSFDGASTINLTVISNPEVSLEAVYVALERNSPSGWGDSGTITIDTTAPFSSDPNPQKLTFEIKSDLPADGSYLSIRDQILDSFTLCLVSNRVDIGPLVKP